MNDKDKGRLRDAILKRYPWEHERTAQVRDFLEIICIEHIEDDLGDADALEKLCSDDDARYWAQLSEVLLAHEGPDLLIEHQNGKIWIEVICPMPAGAAFAIGPYAIAIDRETLEKVGGGHQHRPLIRKPNGADVPAYTFLDPACCKRPGA